MPRPADRKSMVFHVRTILNRKLFQLVVTNQSQNMVIASNVRNVPRETHCIGLILSATFAPDWGVFWRALLLSPTKRAA